MKRRGFFGAMLAGAVGAVVVVKGQGATVAEAPPESVPLTKADLVAAMELLKPSYEEETIFLRRSELDRLFPLRAAPPWPPLPTISSPSGLLAETLPHPNPNFQYATSGFVTITGGMAPGRTITLAPNSHIEFLSFNGLDGGSPPTIVTKYPNGDGPQQDLLGFKEMAPNGDYLFETNLGEEVRVPAPLPLSRDISINRNAL